MNRYEITGFDLKKKKKKSEKAEIFYLQFKNVFFLDLVREIKSVDKPRTL